MNETIDLVDGRSVPAAAVVALDKLEQVWPGATLAQARAAIVADVMDALELREERGGPGDSPYDPAVYRYVSAYNRDPA